MKNLEYTAQYHQQDLLREAQQSRLARQASEGNPHRGHHHRLTASLLAVLMAIATVALI